MTINELFDKISNADINNVIIKRVEEKYNTSLPVFIQKMLSCIIEPAFIENNKFLSASEIINAPEELDVDFVALKLIPLIDTWENDFITYDFGNNSWTKFNIVDNCYFDRKNKIEDYFKNLLIK